MFQVHGLHAQGRVVVRKRLSQATLLSFFVKLPPCLVGMERQLILFDWSKPAPSGSLLSLDSRGSPMRREIGLLTALLGRKERAHAWGAVKGYQNLAAATCPCCGFEGKFDSFGVHAPRPGANCPACESKERHRLLALSIRDGFVNFAHEDVLHFAPESIVGEMIRQQGPRSYATGDIKPGRGDLVLDIEDVDLPDCSFSRIVCSHVLEHVDDTRALAELRRLLRPDGYAVILVPVVEGWRETFEDPAITDPKDRERFFGQHDHVRYYGADVRKRILKAGFELKEFTAGPTDSPKFGLLRGQKVFRATRGANA